MGELWEMEEVKDVKEEKGEKQIPRYARDDIRFGCEWREKDCELCGGARRVGGG